MDSSATLPRKQKLSAFCLANNIVVMVFPMHTTHVIQPLDVGIFKIYNAAYRNRKTTRSVVSVNEIEGLPDATTKRCTKLAKSFVAYKIISEQVISAFKKTEIFPVSFDNKNRNFIANNKMLRDTPEVLSRARATVQTDLQAWEHSVVSKKRQRLSSRVSSIGANERLFLTQNHLFPVHSIHITICNHIKFYSHTTPRFQNPDCYLSDWPVTVQPSVHTIYIIRYIKVSKIFK
jgi:hypothetical protein